MPAPPWLGKLNKVGLNRVTRHLVPYAPGFGLIVHRGRTSGREFRTPVNVFERPGGFAVVLTYGPKAEWVRNVLAEGGCDLITRGKRYHCSNPRVYVDPSHRYVSKAPRWLLEHVVHANHMLDFDAWAASKNET